MTATRPLRFGIQAGPTDTPYAARRDYWREADVVIEFGSLT